MSSKWGSCSTAGTITLASDLDNQDIEFQDFVIAHELLHLRIPNHGKLLKALMTAHVPEWREHDMRRKTSPEPRESERGVELHITRGALEKSIRSRLSRIRQQIKAGDDSDIMIWLLNGRLACSQRPLRDHPTFGGRVPLPPEARTLVIEWVERVKSAGIRSVVSLLEVAQHERYYIRGGLDLHSEGLFGYYRSQGFEFCHVPATDYQKPSESEMDKVLAAFDRMPKPVLLQCSAAIDRTSPVAAHIVYELGSRSMPVG